MEQCLWGAFSPQFLQQCASLFKADLDLMRSELLDTSLVNDLAGHVVGRVATEGSSRGRGGVSLVIRL